MPKRSLNPGNPDTKQIEQLNQAVEAMLSRADGKAPKVAAGIEPLLRIAAGLRDLPRESFKARLRSELEGRKRMSTVAEPVSRRSHDCITEVGVPRPRQSDRVLPARFGCERNVPFRGWRTNPARRNHDRRFDHRYRRRMARGRPLQRRNAGSLAGFDVHPGRRCRCICGTCRGGRDEAGACGSDPVLRTSRCSASGSLWLFVGRGHRDQRKCRSRRCTGACRG